jgi:uncharacterized protein YdaU (DUF1376 family)
MSKFPSLPLFTDAFIADTGHLSAAETGAYLLLLMMAWRSPGCRLPDDDTKLARWARIDPRVWVRMKPTIMEFWTLVDGHWTQKRLLCEHHKVSKHAETARQNGKLGGRPKSLQNHDLANPAGSSSDTQTKAPNPNPNPIEDTLVADATKAACAAPDPSAPDRDLFKRGKEVLGSEAGGLVTRLKNIRGGNVALVRADIERASQAADAREYVGGILNSHGKPRKGFNNDARSNWLDALKGHGEGESGCISASYEVLERPERIRRLARAGNG